MLPQCCVELSHSVLVTPVGAVFFQTNRRSEDGAAKAESPPDSGTNQSGEAALWSGGRYLPAETITETEEILRDPSKVERCFISK